MAWLLVLALIVVLAAGCGKKPQDSEVQSKWVILNEGREIDTKKIFFADSLYGWALNRWSAYSDTYWQTTDGGKNWVMRYVPQHSPAAVFFDLSFLNRAMDGLLELWA